MRVRKSTTNLNEFKCPGSDGSHLKALKEVAEVASEKADVTSSSK